jgi:PAS domain S-box-containing protein
MIVFTPPLLVLATAWMVRQELVPGEPRREGLDLAGRSDETSSTRVLQEERATPGDWLEIAGLAFGAGVLCLLLGRLHGRRDLLGWQLWGVQLLLVVWAGIRQGLRGGTLVSATAAAVTAWLPLIFRSLGPPPNEDVLFRPLLQAHLLAQCATAVLVSAAASWVRMQEKGYRRIVAHIPVVIYSARLAGRRKNAPAVRKSGGLPPGTPPIVGTPASFGRRRQRKYEVTLVSAACVRVLGCPADSLLGDHEQWLARVQVEDREVLRAAIEQLARQEQPVTCEYRVDGRWLRDTLAPQRDNEGRLIGWDGIVIDVSEQRALADDLRRTTSMFNALVSNLPAGVFFVQGPVGQPIFVNARARQLLGQRENPAAGLDHLSQIYRLYRSDGAPFPNDELPVCLALREGRTTMRDDIVVHRPDGRRVPLVTWAAPVQMGTPGAQDAAVWVLEDLTAMRVSEERYRALVESLPVMLVQANRDTKITYINPATRAITGYELSEISDPASWAALVHPEDLSRVHEILHNALDGQPDRGEIRYRAKDGTEKVAYMFCQPRYYEGIGARGSAAFRRSQPSPSTDDGGSSTGTTAARNARGVIGTTTLMVDVTRERNLERELQRAGRLELIGRLSSGVAHDFNNLLGVVTSLTYLAGANLPPEHPVHDDLRRIAEASEQAAALAAQLLAMSKQKPIVPHHVEVNVIVRRTLELLRTTLPSSIRVESELTSDDTVIQADETQLQQVLMNLCLNARDAMPLGGTLRLGTCAEPSRGFVRLSVQDSGKGISEEDRSHIFEPFFTTREDGTGLGLAVVQQIVEAFGGTIDVQSKPGEGTRFDVCWPVGK